MHINNKGTNSGKIFWFLSVPITFNEWWILEHEIDHLSQSMWGHVTVWKVLKPCEDVNAFFVVEWLLDINVARAFLSESRNNISRKNSWVNFSSLVRQADSHLPYNANFPWINLIFLNGKDYLVHLKQNNPCLPFFLLWFSNPFLL